MVDGTHHLSTLDGVFAIENDGWLERAAPDEPTEAALVRLAPQITAALAAHAADTHPRATFSDAGQEAEVQLGFGADAAGDFYLWFEPQFAVTYRSALGASTAGHGRDMRRYLMRRAPRGPVTERLEPEEPRVVAPLKSLPGWTYDMQNRPWLREGLYSHFQAEKYQRESGFAARGRRADRPVALQPGGRCRRTRYGLVTYCTWIRTTARTCGTARGRYCGSQRA
jgi:hypothetical protein